MLLIEKYCLTRYVWYDIMQTGAAPGAAEKQKTTEHTGGSI